MKTFEQIFRNILLAERNRFIAIWKLRNARKKELGMVEDKNYDNFDFERFYQNCLKMLDEAQPPSPSTDN